VTLEDIGDDLPIRVRVEDQGPGIPAENLETVFERFYTSRPKGAVFGSKNLYMYGKRGQNMGTHFQGYKYLPDFEHYGPDPFSDEFSNLT